MENKEQIDTRKNSPIIQQTFMKTELPSRLFLNRRLSSSTCCFFFLLTLYFEKINHLSAPKGKKTQSDIKDQHAELPDFSVSGKRIP
jgi:hypothetical protein